MKEYVEQLLHEATQSLEFEEKQLRMLKSDLRKFNDLFRLLTVHYIQRNESLDKSFKRLEEEYAHTKKVVESLRIKVQELATTLKVLNSL